MNQWMEFLSWVRQTSLRGYGKSASRDYPNHSDYPKGRYIIMLMTIDYLPVLRPGIHRLVHRWAEVDRSIER